MEEKPKFMTTEEWQPMSTAPKNATNVEVLTAEGKQLVAHWAEDLSGEDQPAFSGWFIKVEGSKHCLAYFSGIREPKAWRPIM